MTSLGLDIPTDGRCPPTRADTATDLAAALELFHLFALIHDDIIDDGDVRRGVPTIHAWATDAHHEELLSGEAEPFGRSIALLAGDHLYSLSWGLLASAAAQAPDLIPLWQAMCHDVVSGEMMELHASAREDVDAERALRIIDLKSGLYTLAYPLRLGAALAGYGPATSVSRRLAAGGIAAGRAFQIQDDLLDIYGDRDETGKPCGVDVPSAKPTLFRARCVAALVADGQSVEVALKDFASSPERAADIGRRTGVTEQLRTLADTYFAEASHHLAGVPFTTSTWATVQELFAELRGRRS